MSTATVQASRRAASKLFQPLKLANGKINLEHRVIHAPMTRNRGVPLQSLSTPEKPNRIWYPGDLMTTYYGQRATKGGLIITEGVPISLEANGMPGVCGIFTPEQVEGWKRVVDAVHQKGGYLYCQLWHAGRATIPQMTGSPAVSASATAWDSPGECYSHIPVGYDAPVRYSDYPPIEMSIPHIKSTIQDYCKAARTAMEIGFDGVEVVAHNGYLPEQFLSTNINKRTDAYGGTIENRCAFPLELMNELALTVGQERLAIRLTPFGLFNQARSEQRVETWTFLCEKLKQQHPSLSYVSFIEPTHEQYFSNDEKKGFLRDWGMEDVTLDNFRAIFADTPFFSAGGWNDQNAWDAIESGSYDGLLFARLFASNPDLVHRLRHGLPLAQFEQSRFFGPFEDNVAGYIDYPSFEQ